MDINNFNNNVIPKYEFLAKKYSKDKAFQFNIYLLLINWMCGLYNNNPQKEELLNAFTACINEHTKQYNLYELLNLVNKDIDNSTLNGYIGLQQFISSPIYFPRLFIENTNLKTSTILYKSFLGAGDIFSLFPVFVDLSKKLKCLIIYPQYYLQYPIKKLLEYNFKKNNCNNIIINSDISNELIIKKKIDYIINDNMIFDNKYIADNTLNVQDDDVKIFKKNLNSKTFNIGISYSSLYGYMPQRFCPLKDLVALTEIENVQIYSLEYGEPNKNFKNTNIINLAKNFNDFYDTGVAIKAMDLVVSIDNVVMNLAGCLGVPTIGIIPNNHLFLTVGANHYKSFYNIKFSFNNENNDWSENIQRVKTEIENIISSLRK